MKQESVVALVWHFWHPTWSENGP